MGNHRSRRDGRRSASDRTAFLSELLGHAGGRRDKPDHKTAMLCRQVQRSLSLAFGGELEDAALADLSVGDVRPAPNAGHLVVELIVPGDAELSVPQLLDRLAIATPRLRHLVARSIVRKRAPELSFIPVAGGVR